MENVSIDTTMCVEESDDDKALKDTMLKEVQKLSFQGTILEET